MQQPLTLYLDLKPGTKPDLAVVAKAALEFDALVKELAYQFDPSVAVTLNFDSGTDGSLKLNSLLSTAKDKILSHEARIAIIIAVLTHFGHAAIDYSTNEIFQEVHEQIVETEPDAPALSDEELDALSEMIARKIQEGAGKKEATQVFKELQADQNISGVGVSPRLDERPSIVVPSNEFAERSTFEQTETPEDKRSTTKVVEVVLISPVLLDAERRWKFKDDGPEFGAIIKDRAFLDAVLSGRYHLEMRAGLKMTIELETREEFDGRVWHIRERNVLKVIRSEASPIQQDLISPAPKTEQHDGD